MKNVAEIDEFIAKLIKEHDTKNKDTEVKDFIDAFQEAQKKENDMGEIKTFDGKFKNE